MALGSMVSLAAQALVGVAMLHFFTPQAAGGFAITAQVAFFWCPCRSRKGLCSSLQTPIIRPVRRCRLFCAPAFGAGWGLRRW